MNLTITLCIDDMYPQEFPAAVSNKCHFQREKHTDRFNPCLLNLFKPLLCKCFKIFIGLLTVPCFCALTEGPILITSFVLPSFSAGVLCFSELFFIKEPHDVTVMRKEAVILDCQAHGEAPIDVRWLKNGVKVMENERVYLLSNGSLFISEVESRRADKSDEGSYQCLAQNKYGSILSQKARLTIASEYHAGITLGTLQLRWCNVM